MVVELLPEALSEEARTIAATAFAVRARPLVGRQQEGPWRHHLDVAFWRAVARRADLRLRQPLLVVFAAPTPVLPPAEVSDRDGWRVCPDSPTQTRGGEHRGVSQGSAA